MSPKKHRGTELPVETPANTWPPRDEESKPRFADAQSIPAGGRAAVLEALRVLQAAEGLVEAPDVKASQVSVTNARRGFEEAIGSVLIPIQLVPVEKAV